MIINFGGFYHMNCDGRHEICECWFSGLVALIRSVLTVVILPSKNVLGL